MTAAAAVSWSAHAALDPITPLTMLDRHPDISRNVTRLIEEFHYSRQRLDNSLSSAILDQYLDTLDRNRVYFLASDIAEFGRYRYEMDDRARSGPARSRAPTCPRRTSARPRCARWRF